MKSNIKLDDTWISLSMGLTRMLMQVKRYHTLKGYKFSKRARRLVFCKRGGGGFLS